MSSELLNPLSSINEALANRLEHDEAFRRRYIRMWAQSEVAGEIRALRKKRGLRQSEVAALTKTGQSAISRIERADYDAWTYKTLIEIACELKARLRVTFEPIEAVVGNYRGQTALPQDIDVRGDGTADMAAMAAIATQTESIADERVDYEVSNPTAESAITH